MRDRQKLTTKQNIFRLLRVFRIKPSAHNIYIVTNNVILFAGVLREYIRI